MQLLITRVVLCKSSTQLTYVVVSELCASHSTTQVVSSSHATVLGKSCVVYKSAFTFPGTDWNSFSYNECTHVKTHNKPAADCSNAVPTTCQQDVFALLVPSSLTSCQRLVDNLLQGC